jgi:predicted transcriptional regulator
MLTFRTETTLVGYARVAVDLKARMVDYGRSHFARQYLDAFITSRYADTAADGDGEPFAEAGAGAGPCRA